MTTRTTKGPAVEATVEDVTRIVATGLHCAFVALCTWRGRLYLAYREAQNHHQAIPGRIVVARSHEAEGPWETVATFATGGDDRDPVFLPEPTRLGLAWGTYVPRWGAPPQTVPGATHDMLSHVALSYDGTAWGPAYQILRPNYWFWSGVHMGKQTWYGAAYHFGSEADDPHSIHLFKSPERVWWRHHHTLLSGHDLDSPSEPCLYRRGLMGLGCVVRQEQAPALHGWSPRPPYREWTWRALDAVVHAPAVVRVGTTSVLAGRRRIEPPPVPDEMPADNPWYDLRPRARYVTSLWELGDEHLALLGDLPSGGDCSYPGLVVRDGVRRSELLVAYYSQHERDLSRIGNPTAADIYLARVALTTKGG
jgi:hypothetical protein